MLTLENINKTFGDVVAVDNLSLTIDKGEFFCLLGPSGCGKTSTLRIIAGFDKPTSGRVLLNGKDITDIPPNKRNVNTVFQNYALFPHLTVYENVAFGLRIKNIPKNEINIRVMESLKLVALEERKIFKPSQLSGGQQQRVALARAIVNQPEILLLDEPLGALDEKLREQMQVELSNIQKKLGITFIFITHNQEEALTMADRMAVMKNGKIEQLGKTEEIYIRPKSKFVAEFIGNMNFLSGQIISAQNNNYVLKFPDETRIQNNNYVLKFSDETTIELDSENKYSINDKITLALRPEQLRLSKSKPNGEENYFKGIIKNEVFFGDSSKFYVSTEHHGNLLVMFQNYLPSGANPDIYHEHDEVYICWNKKAGHILQY
ncbi:MAG: ABC transporter ATP-binding protein [Bacteroidetes bacterium]|nr:ABC transporter ATP-binding protein [Bacteroidota bacterium]